MTRWVAPWVHFAHVMMRERCRSCSVCRRRSSRVLATYPVLCETVQDEVHAEYFELSVVDDVVLLLDLVDEELRAVA